MTDTKTEFPDYYLTHEGADILGLSPPLQTATLSDFPECYEISQNHETKVQHPATHCWIFAAAILAVTAVFFQRIM
eukprot:m.344931 g.344931  ORF g.344931 m.344931 type:complete len:76 (-) comp25429_c0_seq1:59-286(-)